MYNLGIIGTGAISSQLIEASEYENRIKPFAIYSRTIETANKFKQRHNLELAFDNLEAMVSNDKLDIIYIASPNSLHFEQAKLAIEHGKHVLVEKPIALFPDQINELYTLARKHNVFVMEAYVALTYNTLTTVQNFIAKLGEVGKVDIHLNQQTRHFDDYLDGKHVNVFDGKMGGGAIRDLGPYTFYPLIKWFGEPMQSHYFSTKNIDNADETTLVLCHYETFSATVSVSKMLTDRRPCLISGDNGYIEIDNINSLSEIKLFDPTGQLQETVKSTYPHRMSSQLNHFADILDSKTYTSKIYTESLAVSVHSIISENFR